MPRVMEETEADLINEQVDVEITMAEERVFSPVSPSQQVQDLSDGGMVNGVRVMPMQDRKPLAQGRPAVRRAWAWNGTISMLPLAWNPEGTRHDGARAYVLKRHCLCCNNSGFKGATCPACVKNSCARCSGSSDRQTLHRMDNGDTVQGWIIPNFYLSKDRVPFPSRFYGSIDCFLPLCTRRGGMGFLTEQDMRVHAHSRHRMEYQAHMEAMQEARVDEMAELRRRVDALMMAQAAPAPAPVSTQAPLYVSDNPAVPRKKTTAKKRTSR